MFAAKARVTGMDFASSMPAAWQRQLAVRRGANITYPKARVTVMDFPLTMPATWQRQLAARRRNCLYSRTQPVFHRIEYFAAAGLVEQLVTGARIQKQLDLAVTGVPVHLSDLGRSFAV